MAGENETITPIIEVDGQELTLVRATIEEALSTIGGVTAVVTLTGGAPDPKPLLGTTARLEIARIGGEVKREYHGIVVEGVRCGDTDGRPQTRLRIVPHLWRLTKRHDCRIFQEMTTQDIISQVLDEGGVTDYEWQLDESPERVFCCQYRETDFDFISRLMVEDGLYFTIVHDDGADKVIIGDAATGFGDVAPATVPFKTLQGFDSMRPCVADLRKARKVVTDKVFVRDYNLEKPDYKLEKDLESVDEGSHVLELYNYPGRFQDDALAEQYADALLNSIQSTRNILSGQTSLLSLKAGFRFTVEGHPYEPFNVEWMIVSIDSKARSTASFHEEEGVTRDYECRFSAVPTETTTYKAPRRPLASTIPGAQTAQTTGGSGAEIFPDDFGRVKARFFWDRTDPGDDKSSCWIRTEQPNTPDSMLLPRVGWEVSIRFREGDVDQPLCFGRFYNAIAPAPYGLPDGKGRSALQTATSPGDGSSNEMRFDDSAGAEEFFVNASKDLTLNVGNNMSLDIENCEIREVGNNHSVAVTNSVNAEVGANQEVSVDANQNVSVETFMNDDVKGDHTLNISGKRDMKVGGDHKHEVTGNQKLDVSSNQIDLVVGAVEEKADGDWKHDIGAGLIELTTGDRNITVGGSKTETTKAVKVVATKGGRAVEIGGGLTVKVAGAIVHKVKGDKTDKSAGAFTDLVAGAQIVKADNVTFEGEDLVAVVMGASVLVVSKPVILLAGTSVKWDGVCKDAGLLILDN